MIGIDTNVLVRHLVQDDETQADLADAFLQRNCTADDPGFVNGIVLCELVWTLERTYGYARADIARMLDNLFITRELHIENRGLAVSALDRFKRSNIEFSDALICEGNIAAGCTATATFDRKAGRQPGFIAVR
ncbi:MAG TPA: type II toxin-antitoxin system VapC family toxin [Rhizomicrobium sp.]|jgi:predicted nucleic-acid-binding protein